MTKYRTRALGPNEEVGGRHEVPLHVLPFNVEAFLDEVKVGLAAGGEALLLAVSPSLALTAADLHLVAVVVDASL